MCALPLTRIWWAPAIAPSRNLATPHPFVSYVVWLLAQSDMPARWEDVHISSIGSKFSSTHPFSILLLTHVILPRLWRQRNGVRKLERSILTIGGHYHRPSTNGRQFAEIAVGPSLHFRNTSLVSWAGNDALVPAETEIVCPMPTVKTASAIIAPCGTEH